MTRDENNFGLYGLLCAHWLEELGIKLNVSTENLNPYDFSMARSGDKVWDFEFGWGTVEEISKEHTLIVKLDTGQFKGYTSDGKRSAISCLPGWNEKPTNQVLFWGEVGILLTNPKRPPRKVKKTFWINVYTTNTAGEPVPPYIGFHGVHGSKQEAKDAADNNSISIQYPLEIEVDE